MELYLHVGMHMFLRRVRKRLLTKELLMELFLQFGYGMMAHCRALIDAWGTGTVILSPRDLNDSQLNRLARDITGLGGRVMVDPQFYLPHADHERLCAHDYWPDAYDTSQFWTGSDLTMLLNALVDLNHRLGCSDFILPGIYADTVDDDWLAIHARVLEETERIGAQGLQPMATVALSGEATRTESQVHAILDEAGDWPVSGVYLVCEHPSGNYLVVDPSWVANVVDLVAGLRLKGKRVVLGYCNQQMLIAATGAATAIASGTWMNVRSFPPEKFRSQYEEEIKQRTIWYYCPVALSEYQIPFLDVARHLGVLDQMRTPQEMASSYADQLFAGTQPSTVGFTEQAAFRHYLQCLQRQVASAKQGSFDQTVDAHEQTLARAEALLTQLRSVGVTGKHRDFADAIAVNRAALSIIRNTRGPRLRHSWNDL
jgi:hypothetical protein